MNALNQKYIVYMAYGFTKNVKFEDISKDQILSITADAANQPMFRYGIIFRKEQYYDKEFRRAAIERARHTKMVMHFYNGQTNPF